MEGQPHQPTNNLRESYPNLNNHQPINRSININLVKQKIEYKKDFHNGLFNCCSAGCGTCMVSFLCCHNCLVAGARTDFDGSNNCFNSCCLSHCAIRNIIRQGYQIEGTCIGDICKSTLCTPCSAIQLVAEVEKRGPLRQLMD